MGPRLRDLDESQSGFINIRLDGDTLRWTSDNNQEKSAVLR